MPGKSIAPTVAERLIIRSNNATKGKRWSRKKRPEHGMNGMTVESEGAFALNASVCFGMHRKNNFVPRLVKNIGGQQTMVIRRKCKLCGEPFNTADKKEMYCSEYCRMSAKEKQPKRLKPKRLDRNATTIY